MKFFKVTFLSIFMILCFSSLTVNAQVNWDFEGGEDHGFTLRCLNPAVPADDDPDIAGDESITGVIAELGHGDDGLPNAGVAWTIGPPNQFDTYIPAVEEGCHVVGGFLEYGDCNDPFDVFLDPGNPSYVNPRGQESYLNTYNLSQWGDDLHSAANDQIATSPPVTLSDGAMLSEWSHGGGSTGATAAPEPEPDRETWGYWDGGSGIAVLSAEDNSFLASVLTSNRQNYGADSLDLSAFAGTEGYLRFRIKHTDPQGIPVITYYFDNVLVVRELAGDLDGDGDVDLSDLAALLAVYGATWCE